MPIQAPTSASSTGTPAGDAISNGIRNPVMYGSNAPVTAAIQNIGICIHRLPHIICPSDALVVASAMTKSNAGGMKFISLLPSFFVVFMFSMKSKT